MKASYLGKVIEYFDPMRSLDESVKDWYVERPDNPHEDMKVLLLNDPSPLKMLFSGHLGSGKSSTLNRLAADTEVAERFFIVKLSVGEELSIVDLTYSDLLLAIGKRLFDDGDQRLGLDQKLKSDLEKWTADVSRAWSKEDFAGAEVRGGISAWFLSAVGTLKTGTRDKTEFRQKFEPQIPQLIVFINRIIDAIQTHEGGKQVLLVVEDLDKPPKDVSMVLFLTKGPVLAQPRCKIIFTVSTSVLYSGDVKVVEQNFPCRCVLPSFKIRNQDGSPSPEGFGRMREIVERRMDKQLIADAAVEMAVEMSGGVTRELIRIVRGAAVRAVVTRANSIQPGHVEHAVNELRAGYDNSLTRQEQIDILRKVHESKKLLWKDEEPMLDLLHNLMILRYPNGPGWYEVNPIVQQLIED